MNSSDLIAVPLGAVAAIRRNRAFHPHGILATGTIERLAPPDEGLPVESSDVVARISKAVGLPNRIPDFIGLAIRMPAQRPATTPWDVLLVSVIAGTLSRVALRPVASWSTPMSTLMPLNYRGDTWWAQAQLTTRIDAPGLSLQDAADEIRNGGIDFMITQARGRDNFTPLAHLHIDELLDPGPTQDISFDPTINSAPGVELMPRWLTKIRRQAYARSREGRHASNDSSTTGF